jgi:SAM-dependent methyltransferase
MRERKRYGALAVRSYLALIDPMLLPMRPRIVRACRARGARNVLDIACATGAQCRALGRAGMEATGVDLSEEMIAAASRLGGRGTRYVRGSAYELPFDDASFDASLLILALHEHTEDERTAMLREALRVLAPEGSLIVADYTEPTRSALHPAWGVVRFIERYAGPEHSAGFRDYVAQGSLEGLLDRHALRPVARASSHFGAIGLAVVHPSGEAAAAGYAGGDRGD